MKGKFFHRELNILDTIKPSRSACEGVRFVLFCVCTNLTIRELLNRLFNENLQWVILQNKSEQLQFHLDQTILTTALDTQLHVLLRLLTFTSMLFIACTYGSTSCLSVISINHDCSSTVVQQEEIKNCMEQKVFRADGTPRQLQYAYISPSLFTSHTYAHIPTQRHTHIYTHTLHKYIHT